MRFVEGAGKESAVLHNNVIITSLIFLDIGAARLSVVGLFGIVLNNRSASKTSVC